ncbi:hypothetical protein [Desulfobaculum bizertense]|uniref:Uncharacterized protein n=1 Tax=Desulfobaculum bizertense DSM 18034 TaxID=1121442 RepID=A0A1T4WHB0_9BACT|nr:hypothetical protein [Desulfobaculum bizertense]UIJ39351.1 hypothetical protein LWC08_07240 [Desulfobaculum bizertense]SKA76713.1 hypothetical protein SAMN02745702_02295 [Desulfobaculum bizertense DSM 18034]
MKLMRTLFVACCAALLVFAAVGCEKEGPAEKAGKKVDQAVESMQKEAPADQTEDKMMQEEKKMEEKTDETAMDEKKDGEHEEGLGEKAGKAVDDAYDATKEKVKEMTE